MDFKEKQKPSTSTGGGYKSLHEEIQEVVEQPETIRELAERQRKQRQAELTFTKEDEARWAANRARVNPVGQHWPPYDFTKPEGEKNIQVDYTQSMNSFAVMSPEEAHEFLSNMYDDMGGKDTLGDAKTYGLGVAKGGYDAVKTAQGLGGLGVQAYTKNINGKDWVIIKNFRRHKQTLMKGNKWLANNPKIVEMGLGINEIKGAVRYVKINIGIEFIFSIGINAVDYILNDETELADFVSNSASDFVKGVLSVGVGLGVVALLPATATLLASSMVFIVASTVAGIVLNDVDSRSGYTNDMTQAIEDYFDE